jgi:ubiquinone biosynthesis protein COQ4
MLADWRAMVDWQISDIQEELGITPVPPEGLWADTNNLVEDALHANDDVATAFAAE